MADHKTVKLSIENLVDPFEGLPNDMRKTYLAQIHGASKILRKMADYQMYQKVVTGVNTSLNFEGLVFHRGGLAYLDEFIQTVEGMASEYESELHPDKDYDPQYPLSEN